MNTVEKLLKIVLICLAILVGPILLIVIGVTLDILKYIALAFGILLLPVFVGIAIGYLIKR